MNVSVIVNECFLQVHMYAPIPHACRSCCVWHANDTGESRGDTHQGVSPFVLNDEEQEPPEMYILSLTVHAAKAPVQGVQALLVG